MAVTPIVEMAKPRRVYKANQQVRWSKSQPRQATSGGLFSCASKWLEPGNENTRYGVYAEWLRRRIHVPNSGLSYVLYLLNVMELEL